MHPLPSSTSAAQATGCSAVGTHLENEGGRAVPRTPPPPGLHVNIPQTLPGLPCSGHGAWLQPRGNAHGLHRPLGRRHLSDKEWTEMHHLPPQAPVSQ